MCLHVLNLSLSTSHSNFTVYLLSYFQRKRAKKRHFLTPKSVPKYSHPRLTKRVGLASLWIQSLGHQQILFCGQHWCCIVDRKTRDVSAAYPFLSYPVYRFLPSNLHHSLRKLKLALPTPIRSIVRGRKVFTFELQNSQIHPKLYIQQRRS